MLSHEMSYLTAYKERLLKKREAAQAKKKEKPLRDQITEWFENLPPSEKRMSFSMDFFVNRFGWSAAATGLVLHELAWQRIRVWGKGPYRRFWIPPINQ